MKHRGFGRVYQPTYKNKQTGEVRKSQTYWLCYYVHGHRIIESANTNKEAVANRLLKERTGRAAIGQPVGPQIERTTIDDLLKLVTDDYIANSRRSLDRVEGALPHLRDHFGADCKARDITEEGLTAYQAHRREEGAKPSTINYELAILRRGFSLGRKRVASHPEFQMLHVDNVRKGFFEREQYEAVLHQLPEYLRPVVIVTYITGWRTQSELLIRQWKNIDLTKGWLRLEPGESKNGEGREFPFTPELRAVLEGQRERVYMIERATKRIIPWVFVYPDGSPIKDFRSSWENACHDAGVPGRLVHDFRRTAVRNLERAGVPRSAAMKMTGHQTEAIYRRYAITDSTMLQEAAAKLAALHTAGAAAVPDRKVSTTSAQVAAISGRK